VLFRSHTAANVQTTNATFFKSVFPFNFTQVQNQAFDFFLDRYGLDFYNATPTNSEIYGVPQYFIPGAVLYLFTFNHFLVENQQVTNFRGVANTVLGDVILSNGINGNCASGQSYLWEVLFNVTYLAEHHINGSFGVETADQTWSRYWTTAFYGVQRYAFDFPNFSLDKWFYICGFMPSIATYKLANVSDNTAAIRLNNFPVYVDMDTGLNGWGICDGHMSEMQKPGFVFSPDVEQTFKRVGYIQCPPLMVTGVTDKSCMVDITKLV